MENALRKDGYGLIAGVDEAGRGAWAGPLVAAAVVLPENARRKLPGLKDSKGLTPAAREVFYKKITELAVAWSVTSASAETIDRIGIQPANLNSMITAIRSLKPSPDVVLVDGFPLECEYDTRQVIRGDEQVLTIAAASILAKVTRDRLMIKMHRQFPKYGFTKHKGYGTAAHHAALKECGVSAMHRKSYKPVAEVIEAKRV